MSNKKTHTTDCINTNAVSKSIDMYCFLFI